MADIRIGISGWRYEPWRGIFYPKDLPQKRELEFASRAFSSIEINGSFYSLQTPSSYAAWRDATPEGFVFSVKGPRYLTHIRRLKDIEAPLANFLASGLFNLGPKLGPILWQFPPSMRFDEARFGHFFSLLPHSTGEALAMARRREGRMKGRARLAIDEDRPMRHAIEIRHESFATEEFIAQLRKHDIAVVVADTAGKWPCIEDATSEFMYLRLHGDAELYASGYTEKALDRWAARISAWSKGREPRDAHRTGKPAAKRRARDVFCYFDNDVKVRAPFDAARLMQKLGLAHAEGFEFPGRKTLKHIRPVRSLPSGRWESSRKGRRPSV